MGVDGQKVIFVVGPTASGKTDLALELALRFGGEIINADSRQFYRELCIGTAKPTPQELSRVPHHLVDCLSIQEPASVAQFVDLASKAIEDVLHREKLPIVVGGTGLYVRSLIFGLDEIPSVPQAIRDELKADCKEQGLHALYSELKAGDPETAEALSANDTQRVLRALEVLRHTGKSIRTFWSQNKTPRYDYVKMALDLERSELYQRINERVLKMQELGLEQEAHELWQHFSGNEVLKKTIGYAEWGKIGFDNVDAVIAEIQKNSRHFAKRQLTWFRNESDVRWFSAGHVPQVFEWFQKEVL